MKKFSLICLSLLLLCGSTALAADQTLYSVKKAGDVVLDGKADKAWDKAKAIVVNVDSNPYEPNNGYEGITETNVSIKSMYDKENIYFLIEYKDPTESLSRFPWVKQKNGTWKKMSNKDSTGHDNTYYEDKFAMFWNINAKNFAEEGCAVSCHMDIPGDKSAGRKFTNAPGETIDMWHAKYVRTSPLGMIDDQYMDNTNNGKKNKGFGRKGDTKIGGGGYINNDNADKTGPMYMNLGGTEADKYFVIPSKRVPFVDTFKAGDVVPGITIRPFQGPRADILARNVWKNGVWTLEIQRKLVTKSKRAAIEDVQFSDMKKAYPFGVAVFDNSQINHVYHMDTLELKFK